jgi:membrane protease YdiL (CAAX protease family)
MNKQRKVIVEVLGVYLLFAGILWSMKLLPEFNNWQKEVFGRGILTVFIGMVLLPASVLWFGNAFSGNCETISKRLKQALEAAGKSMAVMMPATFLSFPVIQTLGFNFLEWKGALIIAGWHALAIPALVFVYRNTKSPETSIFSKKEVLLTLFVFVVSPFIVWGLQFVHEKAAGVFSALIFIGLSEEFLFRGYIQTRLNQVFEKPFALFSFNFGWGIILASLLFALMHVLSPGNPGHWAWGFWTFFGGFCFGVIREKGGSFIASGLVHGIIMMFPVFFS